MDAVNRAADGALVDGSLLLTVGVDQMVCSRVLLGSGDVPPGAVQRRFMIFINNLFIFVF